MKAHNDYTHISSIAISEIASVVDIYTHKKTGARILSILNEDENKVFGITFRTPATDSTGLAHILEHSVLCGSRKYSVKEPFVDLLKGSLQTFLNAMTYPDKTCYPVASQNLKDFYNLVDVYLDAVFFPRLSREIFEQEGWHLDLPESEDAPTIKGVVYNEMKGVYSSPDSRLTELSQQSLFPHTTYGQDSGGNPQSIPDLTYERFLDFHRTHYHPSNAWIFFYGNDDPDTRLELLCEYLNQFDHLEIDSSIAIQQHIAPQEISLSFESMGDSEGGMLTMNWLLPDTKDPQLVLACRILDNLLTGMNASPLRQALIESGLGEDLAGVGLEYELAQMYYSVGMKGVHPENFQTVRDLIMQTLQRTVRDEFDPDLIEAGINSLEFELRENNTGSYPRGLMVMLRALTTWLYDLDPLSLVAFEEPLIALKERLARGEKIFESLIQKYLLENSHHTTVLLRPEIGIAARMEQDEQNLIQSLRARCGLSDEDLIRRTHLLREMQETPDTPESIALLPTLSLSDIEPKVRTTPSEMRVCGQNTILLHDLPANDICYLDLALTLEGVPDRLLPLVPLFARGLTEMGTAREDYIAFSKRINRKTGGVHAQTLVSQREGGPDPAAHLVVRAKAVSARTGDMLDIVHDALHLVRFDDRERFRQMLLEEKSGFEQALIPSGHHFVGLRLRSSFNHADWMQERMGGIENLFFLRDLVRRVEDDWSGVLEDLYTLQRVVVRGTDAVLNLTADTDVLAAYEEHFREFLTLLPRDKNTAVMHSNDMVAVHEALSIPAQVNYVGKIYDLRGFAAQGSILVAAKYLRTSWLWEQVRVLGGAYGGFCSYGRLSGLMSFGSYRDPNIASTIKAFDGSGAFLETVDLDSGELLKAIIGTSGDLDPCQLPDAQGFAALTRHLTGVTDEIRQRVRDEVMATEPRHIRELGTALREAAASGLVCVLGGEDALAQAAEQGMEFSRTLRVL